jgi:hypothetical protein
MERMLRPAAVVMPKSALVPRGNHVQPPPNQFTHDVRKRQPFYYGARTSRRPDGEFAKGSTVVLMVYGKGKTCRVVDSQGRYVLTAFEGLRRRKPRLAPSK